MNQQQKAGILYGLLATLVMSIIMGIGVFTGVAPMPKPIPVALAALVLGKVAQPVLMITGLVAHFIVGGIGGWIYALLFRNRVNIWTGFIWGALLWIVMQIAVLPLLGWGIFGTAETPKIAVATLVLHLIYGGTLGWGVKRSVRKAQTEAPTPQPEQTTEEAQPQQDEEKKS